MKRSEVVSKIEDVLATSWHNYIPSDVLASEILSMLEGQGMIPPRRIVFKEGTSVCFGHSWESENNEMEKKNDIV